MRDGLALVRLVDHAGQHHQPVDPELLDIARVAAGERGGVLGDAGQHRNAAADDAEHLADDRELLRVLQRGVLADGAEQNDAVNAGLDHRFEVPRGGCDVEGLVVAKLRGEGGEDPAPGDLHEAPPAAM